ncbi:MAG: TIGR01777 family oxidoreductase [Oceanospirillaceae bacterium]
MNILIAGGTGFIGTAICTYLVKQGHSVVVKTRYVESANSNTKAINSFSQIAIDEKFDVAINLAGEPIANKRWSKSQVRIILESRLDTTAEFIAFFKESKYKPALFISSSAIGYYGLEDTDALITEDSAGDESFSSTLCTRWEAAALKAELLGIRTCILRTGIVLGKNGGALAKMLPPFKLGFGGKIGSGKQWMSWIHLSDMIAIIDYCIKNESLKGAINCTAPNPVTNGSFTKALGKVLKRPTLLPLPAIVIKLLMGEMGKELLLSGKRIIPFKLNNLDFKFNYERLEDALLDVLKK